MTSTRGEDDRRQRSEGDDGIRSRRCTGGRYNLFTSRECRCHAGRRPHEPALQPSSRRRLQQSRPGFTQGQEARRDHNSLLVTCPDPLATGAVLSPSLTARPLLRAFSAPIDLTRRSLRRPLSACKSVQMCVCECFAPNASQLQPAVPTEDLHCHGLRDARIRVCVGVQEPLQQ